MPPKQLKSREELTAIYVREFLNRYGTLPPGVERVVISPKVRVAPHLPNWSVTLEGPAAPLRVMSVRLVEADLQVRYDLEDRPEGGTL